MSLPIRLLPEAASEFEDAVEWYEQRVTGLGNDFYSRVKLVIRSITATPRAHAKIYGDVRKAVVSRFPFIVLYREDPDEVGVISVFHTSRDPSEWQSRI